MNRGKYRHLIEIWETQKTEEANRLGEKKEKLVLIKSGLFANIETRIGGLLSGRPADTVMTSVTHKFTWDYQEFPTVIPDKHFIVYRNIEFGVNYTLNDGFKDEELQVFVTEKT